MATTKQIAQIRNMIASAEGVIAYSERPCESYLVLNSPVELMATDKTTTFTVDFQTKADAQTFARLVAGCLFAGSEVILSQTSSGIFRAVFTHKPEVLASIASETYEDPPSLEATASILRTVTKVEAIALRSTRIQIWSEDMGSCMKN
jgi:hypothetical protein